MGERATKETREVLVDRMRSSGIEKTTAHRLADQSLRRVEGKIERGENQRKR